MHIFFPYSTERWKHYIKKGLKIIESWRNLSFSDSIIEDYPLTYNYNAIIVFLNASFTKEMFLNQIKDNVNYFYNGINEALL